MTGKTCTIRSLLPFHQPSSFDHPELPAIGILLIPKDGGYPRSFSRCIPVANLLKQLATPNCFGLRIFFSIFGGPNGRGCCQGWRYSGWSSCCGPFQLGRTNSNHEDSWRLNYRRWMNLMINKEMNKYCLLLFFVSEWLGYELLVLVFSLSTDQRLSEKKEASTPVAAQLCRLGLDGCGHFFGRPCLLLWYPSITWMCLVGGFNPFEKYARQIGLSSPIFGVKIKNIWNHHLVANGLSLTAIFSVDFVGSRRSSGPPCHHHLLVGSKTCSEREHIITHHCLDCRPPWVSEASKPSEWQIGTGLCQNGTTYFTQLCQTLLRRRSAEFFHVYVSSGCIIIWNYILVSKKHKTFWTRHNPRIHVCLCKFRLHHFIKLYLLPSKKHKTFLSKT